MKAESEFRPDRELYAVLHLSPDASDEEIRKSYRIWAQLYHPDKYRDPLMKEIATKNFPRVSQAYEILSDVHKRQIYDIYGMEGLSSGLELGTQLNKVEELKEELERLRRMKEQEKVLASLQSSGSIQAELSLPQFLYGNGIMRGMAMSTEVQSQLSKSNGILFNGSLSAMGTSSGAVASTVFSHQISPASTVEFVASAGLRSIIGMETSRQISPHSNATIGITMSLRDGSFNLSNSWIRKLSDTTTGNIQLVLGREPAVSVGWKREDPKLSASGEVKVGTTFANSALSARCSRSLSSKSHASIGGKFGGTAIAIEFGGGRKISDLSTVRMLYSIGIRGIFWKLEIHRGSQKLIIPILLSRQFNPIFITTAFVVPTSVYFIIQAFVLKPYYRKREKQKLLAHTEKLSAKIKEAKETAEKCQMLLQNVASRKKDKQSESGGLVITLALYGHQRYLKERSDMNREPAPSVVDVTIPLNFLVDESGSLKLHEGVKKTGIMGFYDPCPGEPKVLFVEYRNKRNTHVVVVDDFAELVIPQEVHMI